MRPETYDSTSVFLLLQHVRTRSWPQSCIDAGTSILSLTWCMVPQLSDATCDAAMWTAPVLFNIRGAGLGLTLGYATIDSLLLMDSEDALDAYYKTQVCRHRVPCQLGGIVMAATCLE